MDPRAIISFAPFDMVGSTQSRETEHFPVAGKRAEMRVRKRWPIAATRRAVLTMLLVTGALALARAAVLVPYFENAAGSKPFDVQMPLSAVTAVIQLGMYGEGVERAYAAFAVYEAVFALAAAAFFVFFWTWMFRAYPNRLFAFLEGGGILLAPVAAFVCDIAESTAFMILITGLPETPKEAVVELGIAAHRLKFAFEDLRIYLTAFFALAIFAQRARGANERPRKG